MQATSPPFSDLDGGLLEPAAGTGTRLGDRVHLDTDSIDPRKAESLSRLAAKDGELVAQREHFSGELGPRANHPAKGGDWSDDDGDHEDRQAD